MKLFGIVLAVLAATIPAAAAAQVTCTPTYGGGTRCVDAYGNTTTTTPTYGGGYRTTDQNGRTVTCVPTFGGGSRCY